MFCTLLCIQVFYAWHFLGLVVLFYLHQVKLYLSPKALLRCLIYAISLIFIPIPQVAPLHLFENILHHLLNFQILSIL